MSTFQIIRMSLTEKGRGGGVFEKGSTPKMSKTAFLQKVFDDRREFTYRGTKYTFIPWKQISQGGYIFGIFGKDELRHQAGPSEEDFEERNIKSGATQIIAINTNEIKQTDSKTHTGQTVIFETKSMNPNFITLLKHLIDKATKDIVRNPPTRDWTNLWRCELSYLASKERFWGFFNENKPEIKRIEFVLLEPNGQIDLSKNVKSFFKNLQKSTNTTEAKIEILKPKGLVNGDSEEMQGLASYVTEGAGKIVVRGAKRKTLFDSSKEENRKNFSHNPQKDAKGHLTEIGAQELKDIIEKFLKRTKD